MYFKARDLKICYKSVNKRKTYRVDQLITRICKESRSMSLPPGFPISPLFLQVMKPNDVEKVARDLPNLYLSYH